LLLPIPIGSIACPRWKGITLTIISRSVKILCHTT